VSDPADEYFADQWYLSNTVSGEFDLNILKAWNDYRGKGLVISVIDSGIDVTHPDLAPNCDTTIDHDFESADDDGAPDGDAHGAAVAGVLAAARDDDFGIVGVAYEAALFSAKVGSTDITDQTIVDAQDYSLPLADVMNMSIAAHDRFGDSFNTSLRDLRNDAVHRAVSEGRDGLGSIVVKAVGNSRDDGVNADVNATSRDSSTEMIIVAGVRRDGTVTDFSTPGAAVLVSAFGGDDTPNLEDGIVTDGIYADYDGFWIGYGTSFATPMVSGIVALMLDANPNLGWRDAQTILAMSARHVGSDVDGVTIAGDELTPWYWNAAETWNGGGMHFSNDYGYGLVDAWAAVKLAESWRAVSTSANEIKRSLNFDVAANTVVPDGDALGRTFEVKSNAAMDVERVRLVMEFSSVKTEDLEIYIESPDGEEHRLLGDVIGFEDNNGAYDGTHYFDSQAFRGESAKGTWSIRVVDDETGNAIDVSSLKITLYGAKPSKNDIYVYTDEFSDFLDTHSTRLADTNGGSDTLDASALSGAMTANLAKGSGMIDGVAITISGIEDVFAGDGDDRLTGSKGDNDIAGGRGADRLTGGKGDDDFIFRIESDTLADTHDVITDFGKGKDDIDLKRIDAIAATEADDKFAFLGAKDFSGAAGQLRFARDSENDLTLIEADVGGDGIADFTIELAGLHKLAKGDFIL
jgi:subtilisin-like proprotein convertase family protein